VTFDWRGQGQSSGEIVSDPLQVVDDLAALIEHLDMVPAHMVGQSGGGAMVLHLAAHRPELFRSLSVHEPALMGLLAGTPHAEAALEVTAVTAAKLRAGDYEGAVKHFVQQIGGDWSLIPPPFQ